MLFCIGDFDINPGMKFFLVLQAPPHFKSMRLSQFQVSISGTEVNYLPLVNLANLQRYVELIYRKDFLLLEFFIFYCPGRVSNLTEYVASMD